MKVFVILAILSIVSFASAASVFRGSNVEVQATLTGDLSQWIAQVKASAKNDQEAIATIAKRISEEITAAISKGTAGVKQLTDKLAHLLVDAVRGKKSQSVEVEAGLITDGLAKWIVQGALGGGVSIGEMISSKLAEILVHGALGGPSVIPSISDIIAKILVQGALGGGHGGNFVEVEAALITEDFSQWVAKVKASAKNDQEAIATIAKRISEELTAALAKGAAGVKEATDKLAHLIVDAVRGKRSQSVEVEAGLITDGLAKMIVQGALGGGEGIFDRISDMIAAVLVHGALGGPALIPSLSDIIANILVKGALGGR